MASEEQYVHGLCEPNFDLKTCGVDFLISPCSCSDYHRCVNHAIVTAQCAPGTTFDGTRCTDEKFVCRDTQDTDTPWDRCNVTEPRLHQLKFLCTNETTVTTPDMTAAPPGPTDAPDTISAGLVIGLIIAGAVFAIIVIALVIWFRRRRNRSGIPSKRGTIAENPEYFENGNLDDPYATIPDTIPDRMSDPTYNSHVIENSTMSRSNGTLLQRDMELDVEYDNSAFKEETDTDASGYTNTLRGSMREYETPISATVNKGAGNQAGDFGANGSVMVDGQHSADVGDSEMNTEL